MEKLQRNYRDMTQAQFDAFIAVFNKTHVPREHKPDADNAHFTVYNYGSGKDRYSLHYDRHARALQVTAYDRVHAEAEEALRAACISVVRDPKRTGVWLTQATPLKPTASHQNPKPKQKAKQATPSEQSGAEQKTAPKVATKPDRVQAKKQDKKDAKPAEQNKKKESKPKAQSAPAAKAVAPTQPKPEAYRDGYSLTKYDRERLEQGLTVIEGHSEIKGIKREETNPDTPRHTVKITIAAADGNRAIVQYAVKRRVVQIQGKPSALTDFVQSVLSEQASSKDIVAARLAYNATRAPKPEAPAEQVRTDAPKAPSARTVKKATPSKAKITPKSVEKALDRALPNGIRYLSKQSQTYLYYAMIDLESNLANYGGILATAYQGLEHLIATLQQSMGIKVKMIGQAYEKEGTRYVLKLSYRRRIKSIVYAEVMSALYCEYFDKRHFYTHSDNFSDTARILSDKQTAKDEFDRLIGVIEYNCTKLTEIGFTALDPAIPMA